MQSKERKKKHYCAFIRTTLVLSNNGKCIRVYTEAKQWLWPAYLCVSKYEQKHHDYAQKFLWLKRFILSQYHPLTFPATIISFDGSCFAAVTVHRFE